MIQQIDTMAIIVRCQRLLDTYHNPSTSRAARRATAADMQSTISLIDRLLTGTPRRTPDHPVSRTPDLPEGCTPDRPDSRGISTTDLPLLAECRDFLSRSLK